MENILVWIITLLSTLSSLSPWPITCCSCWLLACRYPSNLLNFLALFEKPLIQWQRFVFMAKSFYRLESLQLSGDRLLASQNESQNEIKIILFIPGDNFKVNFLFKRFSDLNQNNILSLVIKITIYLQISILKLKSWFIF